MERIEGEVREIILNLERREILAVGLFGSLARGEFNEKSDIDIFIITDRELTIKEQDELYYVFSKLIPKFRRGVTVLVYDIEGLKRIPSWQTLNLVRDARFIYDKANIREIFRKILEEAEKHGIVYDEGERVFKVKKHGRVFFSLNTK